MKVREWAGIIAFAVTASDRNNPVGSQ